MPKLQITFHVSESVSHWRNWLRVKLKTWQQYRGYWKPFVAGILAGFVLIAIIFALPLKTVSTKTTETDYVIEKRQEPYVVSEPYVTEEVRQKTNVFADGFHTVVPYGIVIPFYIDKPEARLVGEFQNPIPGSFIILDQFNHIVWEKLGSRGTIDLPLPPGQYRAKFQENLMWGEDCSIYLATKWSEVEQVINYREVIKYREVPVQAEKQRTIIKQDRISLWKHIFD